LRRKKSPELNYEDSILLLIHFDEGFAMMHSIAIWLNGVQRGAIAGRRGLIAPADDETISAEFVSLFEAAVVMSRNGCCLFVAGPVEVALYSVSRRRVQGDSARGLLGPNNVALIDEAWAKHRFDWQVASERCHPARERRPTISRNSPDPRRWHTHVRTG
jgi:hypothetical protein